MPTSRACAPRSEQASQRVRRVLVTGAAGFVGRHAVSALRSRLAPGDIVAGIGRGDAAGWPDGVDYHRIDLLDSAGLSRFVAAFEPTDILHLAALSSVQQSSSAPTETWRSNVVGLLNLADALLAGAPRAVLYFVSSGEVYGRAFLSEAPVDESVVPEPASSYARSKLIGEQMLRDILLPTQVKLIILRPFNHTGVGQDERFVVPSFACQIARIEAGLAPPRLEVGNLTAQRDFLDVTDVTRAYVDVIEASDRLQSGTIFNISSGVPRSIAGILDDLRAMARQPFEVIQAPDRMRPSDIPVAIGDARHLRKSVGWTPTIDPTTTLSEILADARSRFCRAADRA